MSELPKDIVRGRPYVGGAEMDIVQTGVPAIDFQTKDVVTPITIDRNRVLGQVLVDKCAHELKVLAVCRSKHPLRFLGPIICEKEVDDLAQCKYNFAYEMAMEQKRRRYAREQPLEESEDQGH